ncbi:MAG: RecX family transcriptional regulator [Abditibacteriaceae bacterium]
MPEPFPGTITSVVASAKTRRHLGARVNVFIDEKFSFALSLDLALEHGLKKDLVIDVALLKVLLRQDGDAKATARALNFLGFRQRSENEVRQKLREKEFPDDVIDRVLDKLRRNYLISDREFAVSWVENRSRNRPRGARMLQQELRQKGISTETIAAVMPNQDDELVNAVAALQKILRSKERAWEDLEEKERYQKAIQYLMRRGFNFSVCKTAWDECSREDE